MEHLTPDPEWNNFALGQYYDDSLEFCKYGTYGNGDCKLAYPIYPCGKYYGDESGCDYWGITDYLDYGHYYPYPDYYRYEDSSMIPIALFSMVSFLMQIMGLAAYTESIMAKTGGTNYKGMLIALQLTWGMTSFSGVWATFGGESALNYFWGLSQLGFLGTIFFNWLGLIWAQYKREEEGVTSFGSSDNLIAMGLNVVYNMLSFGMHLWLQGQLCSIRQF